MKAKAILEDNRLRFWKLIHLLIKFIFLNRQRFNNTANSTELFGLCKYDISLKIPDSETLR